MSEEEIKKATMAALAAKPVVIGFKKKTNPENEDEDDDDEGEGSSKVKYISIVTKVRRLICESW